MTITSATRSTNAKTLNVESLSSTLNGMLKVVWYHCVVCYGITVVVTFSLNGGHGMKSTLK